MNKTKIAERLSAVFEVGAVRDPVSFITHLEQAYAVREFTIKVRAPNPYDAHELFHKPHQRLVKEAEADQSTVKLTSKRDLNRDVTVAMAQSAAACQEIATAVIVPKKGKGRVTKRLRGSIVTMVEDVKTVEKSLTRLFKRMRERYQSIRHRTGEEDK